MKFFDRFKRKAADPIPADFTPKPSMFNALLRIEHDVNYNPYKEYGIDLAGLTDQQVADAMNSAPASLVVYHQLVSPEMVGFARSGKFRNMNKKDSE